MGKSFDKKLIVDKLIANLNSELELAQKAASSALELATQEDSKPEGKYDTRALEASYLAGAQRRRVEEIKQEIQILESLDLKPSHKVEIGSLVELQFKGQRRWYFLTSIEGGSMVAVEEVAVMVISVFSPLGSEALGLSVGDFFDVETPKECRSYEIVSIC